MILENLLSTDKTSTLRSELGLLKQTLVLYQMDVNVIRSSVEPLSWP